MLIIIFSIAKDHAEALVVGLMSAFSETTIAHFVGIIRKYRRDNTLTAASATNTSIKTDNTTIFKQNEIIINFDKSLQLLSLQSILDLLIACKARNIKVNGINDVNIIDWDRAVQFSKQIGQDCTQTEYARNLFGNTYLSEVVSPNFLKNMLHSYVEER